MSIEEKEMRQVYVEELLKIAENDADIMVLEADLSACTGTAPFKRAYPARFLDVGIAEANMVGVAAGLAASGKKPIVHSFTPFVARRALDQIAISVLYSKLNVKLVGLDPGIMATNNGGTHMSVEDVGIMRILPGMTVFEPCDSTVLKQGLPQMLALPTAVYMRLFRKKTVKVFDEKAKINIFKASELKAGKDVTIIATGIMVAKAVEAAEKLVKDGISAGVLCVHTTKPLDNAAVIKAAKTTGAIVTAENHSVINGLGGAVCEVLAENYPIPVQRVGIKDRFGEVGNETYLTTLMKLDVKDIVHAAKAVIQKKGR